MTQGQLICPSTSVIVSVLFRIDMKDFGILMESHILFQTSPPPIIEIKINVKNMACFEKGATKGKNPSMAPLCSKNQISFL